jgi:hypothetical protein
MASCETRYGGLLRELDAAREAGRPVLSRHAAEQYDARAPPTAAAPETALREAVPDETIVTHEHFDRADQPDLDRVWCYEETEEDPFCAVFLEVDDCIVTTWSTATCHDRALASYLRTRAQWGER